MKEFELKYGCNPNQKPAKIYMKNGSDLQRHIWAHEGACPSIRTELVCGFRAACGSSWGFPGGSVGKESACSVGDPGSIHGLGRFPWRRKW